MSSYRVSEILEPFISGNGRSERAFREVDLPFEEIDRDFLEGGELYSALSSDSVRSSLEGYSIYFDIGGQGFDFKAVDENYFSFIDRANPYIAFDGNLFNEYSHLNVEIAANSERALDKLISDLESLEEGLESYFSGEKEEFIHEESQLAD